MTWRVTRKGGTGAAGTQETEVQRRWDAPGQGCQSPSQPTTGTAKRAGRNRHSTGVVRHPQEKQPPTAGAALMQLERKGRHTRREGGRDDGATGWIEGQRGREGAKEPEEVSADLTYTRHPDASPGGCQATTKKSRCFIHTSPTDKPYRFPALGTSPRPKCSVPEVVAGWVE
jgi:hypothetical protein